MKKYLLLPQPDIYYRFISEEYVWKELVVKKIFICFTFLALLSSPAFAKAIKVSALQPFGTENPSETLKVMALETVEFKNGIIFKDGAIIKGKVFDVTDPKRAKRNATFKFQPVEYTYNGKTTVINNEEFIGRYSPVIDKGDIALSAASTAGGILLNIPGLGQAVSFVKGAVKDPDENRLKSGVKQIYKDSPLSYIEEGKEVVLAPDSIFVLKFKTGKDDEHEMYEGEEHADKIKEQEAKGQKLKEQNTDNQQTPAETKQKEPPLPEVIESEAVMNEPLLKPYDPYKVLREVELKTARGY